MAAFEEACINLRKVSFERYYGEALKNKNIVWSFGGFNCEFYMGFPEYRFPGDVTVVIE